MNIFGVEIDYMALFFLISAALVFVAVYSLASRSKRKQQLPPAQVSQDPKTDPSEETRQPSLSTAPTDVQELRVCVDAMRGRKALELKESMQGLLQKYAEEDESLITSLKEKEAELEAKRHPVGWDPEEQAALTRLIAKETLTTDEKIWLGRLLKQAGSTLETKAKTLDKPSETQPEKQAEKSGKGKNPGKPLIQVIGG